MQPRGLDAVRPQARVLMLLMAGFALGLGLLVYASDRPAGSAMLLPRFATLRGGPLFGAVGSWLPSFVHPFAFGLLSAAASRRRASPAYGVVAAWWAVNLAFELGQHPFIRTQVVQALQAGFGSHEPASALSRYVVKGHFDAADVFALTAGALAAAGVLRLLQPRENSHARRP